MKLSDLFPESQFVEAVDQGLIYARPHPVEPLVIYNYTQQCQFQGAWNECTTQCRGLIATIDGDVVARPFPKFFNYGEPNAPDLELSASARVTDKIDGSLGILYPCPSGVPGNYFNDTAWSIATRGSFDSEQAKVGTGILKRYLDEGLWMPLHGLTYLFEIIYPENRIVVDYGDMCDLVLLAVINNRTGSNLGTEDTSWPGPMAQTFEYRTLAEALAAEPRPNSEGLVVEAGHTRLKIKQEDYVALHRIVTGLNERIVWEQLGAGVTVDEIKAPLPEEFANWVEDVALRLMLAAHDIEYAAGEAFVQIRAGLPEEYDRKDFALETQKPEYADVRPYLFLLLDKKDIEASVWKSIRPAAAAPRDLAEAA
jgi:RNA ligase